MKKRRTAAGGGFLIPEALSGGGEAGASLSVNMKKINAEDILQINRSIYLG